MGAMMSETLRERWARERFGRRTEAVLPVLYRAARGLARNRPDAEDLVQETYLKAYQAVPRAELDDPGACRAWLLRILINTYRDHYRRRLRSPEVEAIHRDRDRATNVVELAPSRAPGPADALAGKNFLEAVRQVIAGLSPEVRLVVTLFFVDELSYGEIAEIAQCPLGTVMSRLARGRRILRERLGDHRELGLGAPEVALDAVRPRGRLGAGP
jgi:RNA polymerase sigma-70 factor (ECF subfamily)